MKKLWNVLFILFIILFLASTGFLIYNRYTNYKEEKRLEEVRQKLAEEEKKQKEEERRQQQMEMERRKASKEKQKELEQEKEEKKEILPKYKSLYEENSDLVGWIKINDTVIDYPVMQTTKGDDLNFYLHKDWDKKDSSEGMIFVDYRNNIETSNNLVIYGHNMRAGTMFGSLKKYKDKDYYKENSMINFDTLYESSVYEIICVLITDYTAEPISYYDDPNYSTEEEFETYIKNVKENSLYEINTTAEYGEKLITLITCNRLTPDDEKTRLIVVAKKVK